MREHEARFFGNQLMLEDDVLRYADRLDVGVLITAMKPHMRMVFKDGSKISWILIESSKDLQKIGGLEFSQVMFDLTFPPDCLSMCLSRLRGTARL